MEIQSEQIQSSSPYSCLGCREAKRKCNRIYPECTLCVQKNISCTYPHRRKRRQLGAASESPAADSSSADTPPAAALQTYVSNEPLKPTANLVAEYFLDPDIFRRSQLELEKPNLQQYISSELEEIVGDVSTICAKADTFFKTVHTWLPIISKQRFKKSLPYRLSHTKPELYMLILSMQLSGARVTNPAVGLYVAVKQLHAQILNTGIISDSLQMLQSSILIAIYEFGHGIYPAAFYSVAHCARYAIAMEIDKTVLSKQPRNVKHDELEECRRAWWSILVLDRFMNLSEPTRHLVTPAPDSQSYLPVDDEEWDLGTMGPEDALTLGSANSLSMGRFARFAQAAHLLSQVLDRIADGSDDTEQLRRTIFALVNVSRIEAEMRQLEFCTQMAVCYSGIILLDHPQSFPSQEQPHSAESVKILDTALNMALKFTGAFVQQVCEFISPFLLHLIYKVASVYLERSVVTMPSSNEAALNTEALIKSLKLLGSRWQVASKMITKIAIGNRADVRPA